MTSMILTLFILFLLKMYKYQYPQSMETTMKSHYKTNPPWEEKWM